jgi:hypothetical protein
LDLAPVPAGCLVLLFKLIDAAGGIDHFWRPVKKGARRSSFLAEYQKFQQERRAKEEAPAQRESPPGELTQLPPGYMTPPGGHGQEACPTTT